MWPKHDLIDLLGIEHPIIQAPMGGESTPEMAISVCNAGALGGLGCSYMSIEELHKTVNEVRNGTNRPFNLNFFAHPQPKANAEIDRHTQTLISPFYKELGLAHVPSHGQSPCESFNEETLGILLGLRPKVVSFHFGLPSDYMVKALQQAGCIILCSATTVSEARILADSGVDAIIAQGWEAGGHRGTFDISFEDFGVGTLSLVPQIVDAVNVPVVAAGGIADGRGIAAAFALGASGVQMGTAFLSCPEANIDAPYRMALREATDSETRLTRAFSGRPARTKNNRYIETMAKTRATLPDFPMMYGFSGLLEKAGKAQGSEDFQFMLYGQSAAMNRELPAAELVKTLIAEAQNILSRQN